MDEKQTPPSEIPIQQVLDAMLDADIPLNPRYLFRLSDLEGRDLELMRGIWPQVVLWRRQAMLEDVEALGQKDSLLSFESLGRLAVEDEDAKVRQLALKALADYETSSLSSVFIHSLKEDPAPGVRAAAASGLGQFVYAGELEEIPTRLLHEIEELLLKTLRSSDTPEVRRAALESLGYSGRDEMPGLIEKAFNSEDRLWKASALIAMGRSATPQWEPQVMSMLDSTFPILRMEAARAAGELELHDATPSLLEMLDDPDIGARQAAIWSLSQLGGEGVRPVLERLFAEADDTELDFIETAIENLSFNEGVQLMPMFELPKGDQEPGEDTGDEEDWYEELDLEDMDEDDLDEEEDYGPYADEEDEDLAD